MKKKVSIYVCSVILSVVLIGCGAQADDIKENQNESTQETETEKVEEAAETEPEPVELSEEELFQQNLDTKTGEELMKLGNSYMTDNNKDKGIACYEKAGEMGLVDAYKTLRKYAEIDNDYSKIFEYKIKIAELTNDIDDIESVAYDYQHGERGAKWDQIKAIEWYEKAVDAGSVEAMNEIGTIYFEGGESTNENVTVIDPDYEKAYSWYERCAETEDGSYGVGNSMVMLGMMNEYGLGVEQNKEEKNKWFDKAIAMESDSFDPYECIGANYSYYFDDTKEGEKWFRKHVNKVGCEGCSTYLDEY